MSKFTEWIGINFIQSYRKDQGVKLKPSNVLCQKIEKEIMKTWPPFVSAKSTLRFRNNAGWIDVGSKYRWIDPTGKVRARAYKHGPPKDNEIMSDEEFKRRYIIREGKQKIKIQYIRVPGTKKHIRKIRKNSKHIGKCRIRRNPVFITDKNALDLMAQIEGDWWKKEQEFKKTSKRDDYGFYGNLKEYLNFLTRLKDAEDEEERKWIQDMYGQVIYGVGGYNRYFVRGDGRLIFSKSHSISDEKTKLAESLGFDIL